MESTPEIVPTFAFDWNYAEYLLKNHYRGKWIQVSKSSMPSPVQAGFETSALAISVGQTADYRRSNADGSSMHIHEHETHYNAHIDKVDPKRDPIEHLRVDAPNAYLLALPAMFGGAAAALGASSKGVLVTALVGLGIALLTLPQQASQTSTRTP